MSNPNLEIKNKKRLFSEPIICIKCNRSFSEKKNLNKHCRKFHPYDKLDDTRKHQKCGMCSASFSFISELHKHIENEHSVRLNFINETFYTEGDFLEWKQRIEKDNQSSFVLVKRYELSSGEKVTHYKCHRSGHSNTVKDKDRFTKELGSIKSGCSCPAVIKVYTQTVDDVSEMKVSYQSVHVGHNLEVGKLKLSKDERTALASSLNLGIPMPRILDETRQQFSPTKRLGYTTRKDLHNIARDFQIERGVLLHPDDSTSVDILVRKMQNEENTNPVLLYKPLGELMPDYPSIENDDFLLGIMNEAQEKLLDLYGSCIMIDSTHGTNQYGFQLTTILVNDDLHEGLPVATLFSLRTSAEALQPFFAEIKKRLPNFKTKVFMSDDTNSFYNAWQETFRDDARHLLCTWHIIKNWNKNVQTKVKDVTKREEIKADLKSILTEVDLITFKTKMASFINKYEKDEELFVNYFRNTYEERAEKWAYCYRLGLGINTNMKLERWHRQLKFEEAGGTVMKRLDKAIYIVNNAVAKKLLSRVINMERGKLTSRVALIRKKHKLSLEMEEEYDVIECNDKYIVSKIENSSVITYDVQKSKEVCNCRIKCDECNICIHSFSCTCVVYAIQFVICKHIHYVIKKLSLNSPILESNEHEMDSESLIIDTDEQKERQMFEKDIIVSALQKQSATISDQPTLKNTLLHSIQQLQNRVLSIEESSQIKHVQQLINAANSYLDVANVAPKNLTKIPKLATAPVNKKVEKQRKFNIKKQSKK